MTDFLTRISRAALGLTPVAQVLGTSRYADRPQGLALDAEQDVEALPPPAAAPSLPARRAVPSPQAARVRFAAKPLPATELLSIPAPPLPAVEPPAITAYAGKAEDAALSASEPPAIGEEPLPAMESPSIPTLPLLAIAPSMITERAGQAEDATPFAEVSVARDVSPIRKPAREIAAAGAVPVEPIELRAIALQPASAEMLGDPRLPEAAVANDVAGEAAPRTDATHASHRGRPHRASSPPLAQIAEVIDAVGRTIRPRDVAPHVPALSALPSPAGEQAGESAAPVIRVTIGRIDVRAAEPPAPPPEPPAPPAPRLSLDDYLRMPDGGTR